MENAPLLVQFKSAVSSLLGVNSDRIEVVGAVAGTGRRLTLRTRDVSASTSTGTRRNLVASIIVDYNVLVDVTNIADQDATVTAALASFNTAISTTGSSGYAAVIATAMATVTDFPAVTVVIPTAPTAQDVIIDVTVGQPSAAPTAAPTEEVLSLFEKIDDTMWAVFSGIAFLLLLGGAYLYNPHFLADTCGWFDTEKSEIRNMRIAEHVQIVRAKRAEAARAGNSHNNMAFGNITLKKEKKSRENPDGGPSSPEKSEKVRKTKSSSSGSSKKDRAAGADAPPSASSRSNRTPSNKLNPLSIETGNGGGGEGGGRSSKGAGADGLGAALPYTPRSGKLVVGSPSALSAASTNASTVQGSPRPSRTGEEQEKEVPAADSAFDEDQEPQPAPDDELVSPVSTAASSGRDKGKDKKKKSAKASAQDIVHYRGHKDAKGRKHGKGRVQYMDGSVYTGYFDSDKKSGRGVMQYPDGSSYGGEWLNDKKHGRGITKDSSGHKVSDCEWTDGRPNVRNL